MRNTSIGELVEELKRLQVREARIIELIEQRTEADYRHAALTQGDRVYIKNRVRKPSNWSDTVVWDERVARNATVTRVDGNKVYFTTDNGVCTWRVFSNLRRL